MSTLEVMATPRRHVNMLQHILGDFTDQLDRSGFLHLGNDPRGAHA